MAKDDYHVIIYKILKYLYQCLKKGVPVEEKKLGYEIDKESVYLELIDQAISKTYWNYILLHLQDDGFIEGIVFVQLDNYKYKYPAKLTNCMITPLGIEYLTDNSLIQRVKRTLEDIKDIVPDISI